MATQISTQLEQKIAKMIASGQYADANDVLSQAIHLLQTRDIRLEWLRAAIAEPDAQPEFGGAVLFSSELMDKLEQASPDVCP